MGDKSLEFKQISLEEFGAFSRDYSQSSFVQSEAMGKILQDQDRQVLCFGVFENKELIGAGLFTLRSVFSKFKIAHCNQGPLLDYSNQALLDFFFSHVKTALKPYHVIQAVITPNFEVVSRDENGDVTNGVDNRAWIKQLEQAGLKHLGFDNSNINGVGRWMFVKDLEHVTNDSALLSSLNQVARTKVNRQRKSAVRVEAIKDDLTPFTELMKHTSNRRDFIDRPLEYYQSMLKHFGDDIKLFIARLDFGEQKLVLLQQRSDLIREILALDERLVELPHSKKILGRKRDFEDQLESVDKRMKELQDFGDDDQVLAGAIFIHHAGEVTYLFSGSYDEYFIFEASYAIQDAALQWAIEKKAERYNFYGTQGPYSGASDDGIYLFKRGFGGRVLEQPGNFELTINPLMNWLYQSLRKLRG